MFVKLPVFGAYSQYYTALPPKFEVKGNFGSGDILNIIKNSEVEHGSGAAERFWGWCERQGYMVGDRLLAFRGKLTASCTLYMVVLLVKNER